MPDETIRNMAPKDVAAYLNVCEAIARRLMRQGGDNGGIACSDVSTGSANYAMLRTSVQDIKDWQELREHGRSAAAKSSRRAAQKKPGGGLLAKLRER